MTDGNAGILDLLHETDFTGTELSVAGAAFGFEYGADRADSLNVDGAASVSGTNTIDLTRLGSTLPTAQTYDLITAASWLTGTFQFSGGATQTTVTIDSQVYTLLLRNSDTAETLTIVEGTPNYLVFVGDNVVDGSSTIDFGWALANEPTIQTITILDIGTGTLTLDDPITLPTGFTLARDFGAHSLAAGEATSFAIRLDAAVEGDVSGTLSFDTDDATLGTFDLPISGTIIARMTGAIDPGFDAIGDGWTSVDSEDAVGGSELTAGAGTGDNSVSWVFNDLDPSLEYEVFATWTADSGQATNAGYTILDGSNFTGSAFGGDGDAPNPARVIGTLGTKSVDQTAAPADVTVGGIAWSSLGSYTATSGVIEVDLSDDANGTVVGGGVRIVAVHKTSAPVLQPIDDQALTAGDSLSVTAAASDPDVSSGLIYSITSGAPAGLGIDSSTGAITWATDSDTVPGEYRVTVQVSDGGSPALTDSKQFAVTVDNEDWATSGGGDEPVVTVLTSSDAQEGARPASSASSAPAI